VPRGGFLPCRSNLRGKLIDDHEADIVTRGRVIRAGISETGNQANLWNLLCHIPLNP
jgi:hypothetical protein